jgi:hypothetical protein
MAYTTINKPSEYFNTVLWTTDGTGNKALTTGHSTDMVWIKFRDYAYDHRIYDDVRGVTKKIIPNKTDAESTTTDLVSFDANGFTVGNNLNTSGEGGLVGWSWKANGAGVSNTDGDITSTVSASTTSGFSIVKWTGTGSDGTIGHGLGVAPKMVIVKSLANTTAWMVYHASLGNAQEIYLNSSSGSGASTAWNSTTPTYNVISLDGGAGNGVNVSGDYIAYVFAEKKSFSKFGSYTGNGNADGTFVYTGFKPAYVLTKRTDGSYIWSITDGVRNPYNPTSLSLQTEYSNAESEWSPLEVDFLSNGFKLRTSSAQKNGSGSPFIYMAFAENPLVGTNNIPATAR